MPVAILKVLVRCPRCQTPRGRGPRERLRRSARAAAAAVMDGGPVFTASTIFIVYRMGFISLARPVDFAKKMRSIFYRRVCSPVFDWATYEW